MINPQPKNSPSYPQTTANFDRIPNEDIQRQAFHIKQLSIPLIEALKYQTVFFKHEKQNITKQLKQLNIMGEYLHQQNKKLRKHFYQRTKDIQNLMTTMQINLNNQFVDIDHTIHLVKKSNSILLHKINSQNYQALQLQNHLKLLVDQIEYIKKENIEKENLYNIIQAKLQANLNQQVIKNLANQQQNLLKNQSNLLKDINELSKKISKAKKINIQKYRQINDVQYINKDEKFYYQQRTLQTVKKLTQLKKQNQDLTFKYDRQHATHEQLQFSNNNLFQKLQQCTSLREKRLFQIEEIRSQNQSTISRMQLIKKNYQDNKNMQQKLNSQKQELQVQLKVIKDKNSQKSKSHQKNIEETKQKFQSQIRNIRTKMRQLQLAQQSQILKVEQERQKISEAIKSCTQQHKLLQQYYQQHKQIFKQVNQQNPNLSYQIATLQLKLGIKK